MAETEAEAKTQTAQLWRSPSDVDMVNWWRNLIDDDGWLLSHYPKKPQTIKPWRFYILQGSSGSWSPPLPRPLSRSWFVLFIFNWFDSPKWKINGQEWKGWWERGLGFVAVRWRSDGGEGWRIWPLECVGEIWPLGEVGCVCMCVCTEKRGVYTFFIWEGV
jgi:hypothetical protein